MSEFDQLSELCARFRQDFMAGPRPRIDAYLALAPDRQREELLKMLLTIEVQCRRQLGESVGTEEYAEFGTAARSFVAAQLAAANQETPDADPVAELTRILPPRDPNVAETSLTAAPSTGSPEHDVPGDAALVIGPYRIIRAIGEGGMGTVFLAEQTEPLKRRVALKLIKAGLTNREVLARFQTERQALAVMEHQNIAKVLDAGSTPDGRLYFVMEYVPGTPITQYADEHKSGLNARLELFVQVCRALQHAHQKGIIHRDIKPSNVLVSEIDGVPIVKVIDFGLAKSLESDGTQGEQTVAGQIMGTYQYMSPEQAGSNVLDVDTRSDVYSLGVLLFELLTGSTPLEKQRLRNLALLGILRAIREEESPRPSSRLSGLGEAATSISAQRQTSPQRLSRRLRGDLDWITLKALEKDRNRRYEGPAQLAEDVLRFLRGDAVSAMPPSLNYRIRKALWRHRVAFSMGLTVVVLLTAGLVSTTQQMFRALDAESREESRRKFAEGETKRAKAAESIASEQKLAAEEARAAAESARAETERALARSDYFLGVARLEEARPGEASAYLDRIPQKYREFEWDLARQQVDASIRSYFTGAAALGFSTDGGRLMLWSHYGGIRHFQLDGQGTGRTTETSRQAQFASFLKEGKMLALALGSDIGKPATEVSLIDTESGSVTGHIPRQDVGIRQISASQDGTILATVCTDHSVTIWETATGRQRCRLPPAKWSTGNVAVSPNGSMLATVSGDARSFALWNGVTGELIREVPASPEHAIARIFFSPDGRHLAWSSAQYSDPAIHVRDIQLNREVHVLTGHTDEILDVTFSPDSLLLASGSADRTVRLWNWSTGHAVRTIVGHDSAVSRLQFSPCGSRLVSQEQYGTIKVWDLMQSGNETEVHASGIVSAIALNPKTSQVAIGTTSGDVDLWDLQTGRQDMHQRGHQVFVNTLSYSADGEILVSAGSDHQAAFWKTATGELREKMTYCDGKSVNVTINHMATRLAATRADDASIEIHDLDARQRIQVIPTRDLMLSPVRLAFDTQSRRLAAIDGLDRVCIFDANTGVFIRSINEKSVEMIFKPSRLVCFGPLEHQLLSSTDTRGLTLWDLSTGNLGVTLNVDTGFIQSAVFHPAGKRVITAGRSDVRIWDLETGEVLRTLKGAGGNIPAIDVSEDGRRLAVSAEPTECLVFHAEGRGKTQILNGHTRQVISVALTPDGQRIVSGGTDRQVIIWNRSTGQPIACLQGHREPVTGVFISPDGRRVVSRGSDYSFTAAGGQMRGDQTVMLWNAVEEKAISELPGQTRFMTALAFSPDGQRFATADGTKSVTVFDADTGKLIHQCTELFAVATGLAFSTDGTWLKATFSVGPPVFWNAGTAGPASHAPPNAGFDQHPPDTSSDGRWLVRYQENSVVVTDQYGTENVSQGLQRRAHWHMQQLEQGSTTFARLHHTCWLLQLVSKAPETLTADVQRKFNTRSASEFLTNGVIRAVEQLQSEPVASSLPAAVSQVRSHLDRTPDRIAAEYVLSLGGQVRIHGLDRILGGINELPLQPLELFMIDLRENQRITEDGLAACAGCPRLEHLDLVNTPLTDKGLRHFARSRQLQVLDLVNAPIGDEGLQVFDGISTVRHLWLGGTRTTDRGVHFFRNCNQLLQLDLRATKVTDDGLKAFSGCHQLVSLLLPGTAISDAGLVNFRDAIHLVRLDLSHTAVTDAGLADFADFPDIAELSLTQTAVTDASLPQLLKCKQLRILRVGGTRLSPDALKSVREQLPQCQIESTTN